MSHYLALNACGRGAYGGAGGRFASRGPAYTAFPAHPVSETCPPVIPVSRPPIPEESRKVDGMPSESGVVVGRGACNAWRAHRGGRAGAEGYGDGAGFRAWSIGREPVPGARAEGGAGGTGGGSGGVGWRPSRGTVRGMRQLRSSVPSNGPTTSTKTGFHAMGMRELGFP